MKKANTRIKIALIATLLLSVATGNAQTDIDAIMMEKNALCIGPMYSYSSWKNYWEGTFKRDNANLGTVSTQMVGLMGNYGITRKLNFLFSAPYVKTKASAGTLHGQDGVQDLTLFLKYKGLEMRFGDGKLTAYGILGGSVPLTNYVADFLPLSIGLRSKQAMGRVMVDYIQSGWFVTGSATYVLRDNINIDKDVYYTNQQYLSDEVKMPDMFTYNARIGFRNQRIIAEAIFNRNQTLGGFDITKNNMPFPSNKMNASTVGVNVKYVFPFLPQLSIVAGGSHTISGRNVGEATGGYGSFFYVFNLAKKASNSTGTQTN